MTMISTPLVIAGLWLGAVQLAQPVPRPVEPPPAQRSITLRVLVETTDHRPMEGVPIRSDGSHGRTDPDGKVDLIEELPNGAKQVRVWVALRWVEGQPLGAMHEQVQQYRRLVTDYHFPRKVVVDIAPESAEYSVRIVAKPALVVKGRAVQADGKPEAGGVVTHAAGEMFPARTGDDGRFEVGGLPPDAPSEIFVSGGSAIRRIDIRPPLTSLDLGDVVVDYPNRTASVQVTTVDEEPKRPGGGGLALVLLVSSDGERLFGGQVHLGEDEEHAAWARELDTTPVPPGTYYVVWGLPVLSPTNEKLLRLVRSGRDLTASKIPHFTVAAGQHLVFPLDGKAAMDAINAEPDAVGK